MKTKEEMWDDYSQHIDSDLDSMQIFAGTCVVTQFDFYKALDEYANQSKWIPISERYPENMQSILVTNGKVIVAGGFYEGADTFCANSFESDAIVCGDIEKFTHWMPLPPPIQSPPKNKEHE